MTAAQVYDEIDMWLAEHGVEPELRARVYDEVLSLEGDNDEFLKAAQHFELGGAHPFAAFVTGQGYVWRGPPQQMENPPERGG